MLHASTRNQLSGLLMPTAPVAQRAVTAYYTQPAALSKEAYETLALVAYLQPIPLETLLAYRGADAGMCLRGCRKPNSSDCWPDDEKRLIFGTTESFLESTGLASLAEATLMSSLFRIHKSP